MLSDANKLIMQSVIMLNVVAPGITAVKIFKLLHKGVELLSHESYRCAGPNVIKPFTSVIYGFS